MNTQSIKKSLQSLGRLLNKLGKNHDKDNSEWFYTIGELQDFYIKPKLDALVDEHEKAAENFLEDMKKCKQKLHSIIKSELSDKIIKPQAK